ncbi:nitric oxide reductase activation protein [Inmirania thermothiophila]|uniref:Nitric oxide reductase NorD protein n=1 Tax=Inmirania thermothiophila TaxID=1750597 RepID=A0A3N1Y7Q6_9GAMM|nr:nitric oxide reductase activation protein [Inmirania thermothiophila]ROR34551.1 nitric oxide reductase NorD protein [Inmirania thermothiophila]
MGRAPVEAVEAQLDRLLEAVLSSRRTAAAPARALAGMAPAARAEALRWVEVLAAAHPELAYRLALMAPAVWRVADAALREAWLREALDAYDRGGMLAGLAVLDGFEAWRARRAAEAAAVRLEEVRAVLEAFVRGLSGRPLRIEPAPPGEPPHTDTEALYLPARIDRFARREDNLALYRALAVHLWAEVGYGTWRVPRWLGEAGAHLWREGRWDLLGVAQGRYADPSRLAACFHTLERLRLDARLARELPGAAAELARLRALAGEAAVPPGWEAMAARLARPDAEVRDSYALLAQAATEAPPPPLCYQGAALPERVEAVREARVRREAEALGRLLVRADPQRAPRGPAPAGTEAEAAEAGRRLLEAVLEGGLRVPPEEARALVRSIVLDFGEVPPEHLVAAGDGLYPWSPDAAPGGGDEATQEADGDGLRYDEWDYTRRGYRRDWCVLRELEGPAGDAGFVAGALARHRGLVRRIRRGFELLRGGERVLRRERLGDEVDLDALVEGLADLARGEELPEGLFRRRVRDARDVAVLFMVDMSGSTRGWVNTAEREALVLLCEALETLGDRYAIYGFSGTTRLRCEVYRIKGFDEPYGEAVQARIAGIEPRDYTRMGVALRHLGRRLAAVEARTRLLVTLSDGKPDDFDGYRGRYGIEDTRQALLELMRDGIHPFCITIDEQARDYLPRLYGAARFVVLDDVAELPRKVADIYRRIAT